MINVSRAYTLSVVFIFLSLISLTASGCGGGSGTSSSEYWGGGESSVTATPAVSTVNNLDQPGQPLRVGDWAEINGNGFGSSQQGSYSPGYVAFSDASATVKAINYAAWTDTKIVCQVPIGSPIKAFQARETVNIIVVHSDSEAGSSPLQITADPTPNPTPLTLPPSPSPSPSITATPSPTPTETASPSPTPSPSTPSGGGGGGGGTTSPAITDFSPASGYAGDTVTVNGNNFGSTKGTVKFNGTQAADGDITWSDTKITVKVPSDAITGKITITTAAGLSATSSADFEAKYYPTIGAYQYIPKRIVLKGSTPVHAGSRFSKKASRGIITVTSNANSGAGSLRQAIADAGDGDNIVFELDSGYETITLTEQLEITGKSLVIDGENTGGSGIPVTVTVTNPGVSNWRVFYINPGAGKTVDLANTTINGGKVVAGGSIYAISGTLNLTACTISGSNASGFGGAIALKSCTVAISNSTISGCKAPTNGSGGAIYNEGGTLTITNSTMTGCSTGGSGGAILSGNGVGAVTITNSTISGCSSQYGGGISISNNNTLTVTGSTISSCSAVESSSGQGGGILNSGTVTITSCTICGCSAVHSGGGIINAGTLAVTNSTISGCSSSGAGGAILNSLGTAITTISNSTVSGCSATFAGGGILCYSGTITAANSTVSGCSAQAGGGINNYTTSSKMYLLNTIVVNNTNSDLYNKTSGSICSYYSWYSTSSGTITTMGSAPNITDAYDSEKGLEDLDLNLPGTTKTMAVKPGCPAIEKGVYVYYNAADKFYLKGTDGKFYKLDDYSEFTPASSESDKITKDQREVNR